MTTQLDPRTDLAMAPAQLNMLANGGFEQWNVAPSTSAIAYYAPTGADGWFWGNSASGATLTASHEASTVYSGGSSMKVVMGSGTANAGSIFQNVGDASFGYAMRGRTLTFSMAVKTTIANKIKIRLRDGVTPTDSAYHTGSGNWEILTVTKTMDAGAVSVQVVIGIMTSGDYQAGTWYFDAGMLVISSSPVNFVPDLTEIDKVKAGAVSSLRFNMPNILTNGGLEIWQRGTSFANPSGTYTADLWKCNQAGITTVTVSREATIKETGLYSLKCAFTIGVSPTILRIGNDYPLSTGGIWPGGTPIAVKARVRSNVAGCRIMCFWSGGNTSLTPGHSGGDTFETLTAVFTIPDGVNANSLSIWIGWDSTYGTVPAGSGTMYIDSVMAVYGTQVVDYVPEDSQIALLRCLRFCQKIGGGSVNQDIGSGPCLSTSAAEFPIRYLSVMAGVPTVTITNPTSTWKINNPAGGLVTVGTLGFSAETSYSGYAAASSVVGSPLTAWHCVELFSPSASEYILLEVL